jgi:hypothetical protein
MFAALALSALIFVPGCGYTTRSLLPPSVKSIYVDNFKNAISVEAEQSNVRMYRAYRPGMQVDITKAVINRFLTDGNLKVATESTADIILTGELIDFRREPLRYDTNYNIEEYRLKLIVNMELRDVKTGKVMWTEKGFAGESTFRTTGSLAVSEDAAMTAVIEDLARRITERTVEAW